MSCHYIHVVEGSVSVWCKGGVFVVDAEMQVVCNNTNLNARATGCN